MLLKTYNAVVLCYKSLYTAYTDEPNQMLEIQLTFDLEETIDNLSAHLL